MIHSYRLGGYNIVLDVYSGSVHVVDDLAYQAIGLLQDHTRDQALSALSEQYPREEVLQCLEQIAARQGRSAVRELTGGVRPW